MLELTRRHVVAEIELACNMIEVCFDLLSKLLMLTKLNQLLLGRWLEQLILLHLVPFVPVEQLDCIQVLGPFNLPSVFLRVEPALLLD